MATPPTEQVLVNKKTLRDLATILVKDANLHQGLFDISFELQVSIGTLGPSAAEALPGALVGIKSVGLLRTEKMNLHTVDAADVNPRPAGSKAIARKRVRPPSQV